MISESSSSNTSALLAHVIEEWKQVGPPEIDPGEIIFGEKLGEGQFGTVYQGTCRGKEVAVKLLFKQDLEVQTLADFKKEVEIMARLRHPNTLLFMGACTTPGNMAVVTEFLAGDVESLLSRKDLELSKYCRMRMLKEVAQGMNWLHESRPQIIHRDLKPANLLVDANLTVKVCDFGLSTVKDNKMHEKLQDKDSIPGTPLFLAPEVLMGQPFDASSDVYSFAITAWEIFCREDAFPEFTSFGSFKRAVCQRNVRPPFDPEMPLRFQSLLEACWHKEASKRPRFGEIITLLDHILIDIAVRDTHANLFWTAHFFGRERVDWDWFSEKLAGFVDFERTENLLYFRFLSGVPLSDLQTPPKEITLERFGQVLSWFGPFDSRGEFLRRVRAVMREPWFHGYLSARKADTILLNRKKGTFLVRLSATADNVFSVSRVGSTGISHQRISYSAVEQTFTFKFTVGKTHKKICEKCSLPIFISKFLSKELKLTIPCPGSPYEFLFGGGAKLKKGTDIDGYKIVDSSSSDEY